MGNQHDPGNLTPLEFFLSQTLPGDGLRTLHDSIVLLQRLYDITAAHDCGSPECIIPSFRTHIFPYLEWMKEQNYQTLPASAVYLDLGLGPDLAGYDDEGVIDPSGTDDILKDIDRFLKKNQDDRPQD
jgi:hypothetical protein